MLDRKTRAVQRQIKATGEELLLIQEDIGRVLAGTITPGDTAVVFRLRLILNRLKAADEKLAGLRARLPLERGTIVSHALAEQYSKTIEMQRNTVSTLLQCVRQNNAALLEAKHAALAAEAVLIGERIKNNAKKYPS